MAKDKLGGKRGSGKFERITMADHERLIDESKKIWGENIEKQRGFVATSNSFTINNILRNLPEGTDVSKTDFGNGSWFNNNAIVQNMDQLTSKTIPGGKNMTVFRNVDYTWMQNALHITNPEMLLDKRLVGETFTEKSFTCTSTVASENVFQHRPIHWEVEFPKNSRSFIPDNPGESEATLPRNSKFKILGAEKRGSHYVLKLRVIDTPDNSRGFSKEKGDKRW